MWKSEGHFKSLHSFKLRSNVFPMFPAGFEINHKHIACKTCAQQ